MTVTEKVAYLKGLVEGSELKLEKKGEKILDLVLEVLGDLASSVTEIDEDVSVLYDDIEDLNDSLSDLGSLLLDEEDEDGDFMYELQCDKCGEKFNIGEDILLQDEVVCPACGEHIEFEFDCNCDECEGKNGAN